MPLRSSHLKMTTLLLMTILFIAQPSWAGKVVKVKGKKIYIILDSDEVDTIEKGSRLYTTTRSGKKRGLVIVRKKKGNKVIGQLKKGKAKKRMFTRLRRPKRKKRIEDVTPAEEIIDQPQESEEPSDMMYGFLGSYAIASQNVQNVADMSGSMIGFKGVFDYSILEQLGVQARLGMDMLSVTGDSATATLTTSINYLTLDFLLRYYFMRSSSFGLYGSVGMGIYTPMSSDLGANAAIDESSISTTSLALFGLGAAIPFGGWELQLGGTYYYFPTADTVNTSAFGVQLGVMFEM